MVLEGALEVTANGRTVPAPAGTVIHVPKGTIHSYATVGATPVRMLFLYAPAGMERMFGEIGTPAQPGVPAPPLTLEDVAKLLSVAAKYHFEVPARCPGRALRRRRTGASVPPGQRLPRPVRRIRRPDPLGVPQRSGHGAPLVRRCRAGACFLAGRAPPRRHRTGGGGGARLPPRVFPGRWRASADSLESAAWSVQRRRVRRSHGSARSMLRPQDTRPCYSNGTTTNGRRPKRAKGLGYGRQTVGRRRCAVTMPRAAADGPSLSLRPGRKSPSPSARLACLLGQR